MGVARSAARLAACTFFAVAIVLALAAATASALAEEATKATAEQGGYVIVVSKKTAEDAGWSPVVEALRTKHAAQVLRWSAPRGAKNLAPRLAALAPQYVCFVATPEELAVEAQVTIRPRGGEGEPRTFPLRGQYYHEVAAAMADLDDDPYDDAVWSVLTGRTPADALRVVRCEPLTVRRGLSHVGTGRLKWFESGASFSETQQGVKWVKEPGRAPEKVQGPDDSTKQFVAELNDRSPDMVSTSGHATERDWQMGYSYRGGQIVIPSRKAALVRGAAKENAPEEGPTGEATEGDASEAAAPGAEETETQPDEAAAGDGAEGEPALYAVDASRRAYAIRTMNPKVYFAPGNCRIARVHQDECMALGWIHHGAMQFFGHVGLQMSSCYAWGIYEYFLGLQGRYTFAEAVWLNQQALRWELGRMTDQEKQKKYVCCQNARFIPVGRQFFWETTVLYGDPAWEARAKAVTEPLYEQDVQTRALGGGREELTFTVTMRRDERPRRPAAYILPPAPRTVLEVRRGPDDLVVADNFALIPFWEADEAPTEIGRQHKVVVICGPPAEKPKDALPADETPAEASPDGNAPAEAQEPAETS